MNKEDPMPTPTRSASAVSLAYEGGDLSHLETAIPSLTQRGLTGTFFLPSIELVQRGGDWQAAANEGHEMGSHSLNGFTDGRGNLPNWTLDMVEEDLRMSRRLLTEMFPSQTDFAFAFPGDQAGCVTAAFDPQPTDYFPVVDRLFRVSKTCQAGSNDLNGLEPSRLKSVDAFGQTYRELVELVERAAQGGHWLILNFRGVGSGDFAVDAREHELFLDFLQFHSKSIGVVPVYRYAMQRLGAAIHDETA